MAEHRKSTTGEFGDMPVEEALMRPGTDPADDILLALAWYFAFALIVNDLVKVGLLKRFSAGRPR